MNIDRNYCLEYSRISTDEQNPQSCEDQSTINKRFIASINKKLATNGSFRDEGVSGSTLDRAGLQDLLIRCQEDKSIYAVVVTESDRAARGNLSYITLRETLKKFGVKLVAVTQPMINDSEEGEMVGEILGAINGFFSKITRRKSMRALDEKAARGWWPSRALIGYKNVNIGTEEAPNRIIETDEEKALYVRQIPKLYNQGYSYQEIADRFYEEGLRGKNNGKVSPEEVRQILFNDFYLGEFTWRGKRHKANHEILFNWLEVQQARNRSHEKGHPHSGVELRDRLLFKKLPFFCGECKDLHITAEIKIKNYKKWSTEHCLYHCTKSRGRHTCTQPSINRLDLVQEFADKVVAPIDIGMDLSEFLLEEMDREYSALKEDQNKLLVNISKRIGQIDTELKNLFEMRIAGKITAIGDKSPDEVYEEYKQKKENDRIQLLGTQNKLEKNSLDWQKKASNFFLLCQNAEKYFLKAKELPQYLFLRKVSSNLFLTNKEVVVEHRFPFSYLVELNTHPSRLPRVDSNHEP